MIGYRELCDQVSMALPDDNDRQRFVSQFRPPVPRPLVSQICTPSIPMKN